ncbi:M50 family metallopeptidase [Pyxidicoccus sp. 3LG]
MRPHFHVAGFPVRVHLFFFLIAFASGWGLLQEPARLALWMAIVFVSVLLHELGHALALRRYGCAASIELHGLGGTTTGDDAERLTHRQSAWVSFAGPGMGFLLGGLVWALSRFTPAGQLGGLAGEAVRQLLWVNVGWGLFNLLPLQPLDGGHLLASAVRARSGYRYERVLHGIGIVTALGVVALSIWWSMVWMGVLALMFGVMNFEQLRRLPKEVRFQRAAAPRPRGSSKRQAEAGSVTVEQLMGELRSGSLARGKTQAPAAGTEVSRRTPAPVMEPEPEAPEGPHDPALVGAMLLDGGLAAMAVRPLQAAFAKSPTPENGHVLVLALLETGRFKDVAALLEDARAAHLSDDTLGLISDQARAAGQEPLAARAETLRHDRAK